MMGGDKSILVMFEETGVKKLVSKLREEEKYFSDVSNPPNWLGKKIKEEDKNNNTEKISLREAEENIKNYLNFVKELEYEVPEETIKMNIKRDIDRIREE